MVSDSEESTTKKKPRGVGHRRNLSNGVTTLRVSDNDEEIATKVFLPNTPLPMQETVKQGVPPSFPDWDPKYRGCCGCCHLKDCAIVVAAFELCEVTGRLVIWWQLDTFMGTWSRPITAVALTLLLVLLLWCVIALVCLVVARGRASKRLVAVELAKQLVTLVYIAVIIVLCLIYLNVIKQHIANKIDLMFTTKHKWLEQAGGDSTLLPFKSQKIPDDDYDEFYHNGYDTHPSGGEDEPGDFFQEAAKILAAVASGGYFVSLLLTFGVQSWMVYWIARYYRYHQAKELYFIRQFRRTEQLASVGHGSTVDDDPPPPYANEASLASV